MSESTPSTPNLLVTGAAGFVGSATADAAVESGIRVRRMVRDPAKIRAGDVDAVIADLAHPDAVARACEGVDAIVHTAGYVGRDPDFQRVVNVEGARVLVAAARAAGVSRIVYTSTVAVYGSGTHRGVVEGELPVNPESSLSWSRVAAEEIVLEAGGFVVRPDLTFGPGDRWVVPALVRVNRMLDGWIDGGAALTSALDVRDLGALLVALATAESHPAQRVFHAAALPVPIVRLGEAADRAVGLGLSSRSVPRAVAEPQLIATGLSAHQIDLIATDHWYDARALWSLAGRTEPATPVVDARAADWYGSLRAG
ncbi:NAD-dependent epimerase/dehydratase family protein [Leifsonia poae]|uniref:NAD-dependent epimerase/dehydratase family protein n=1 Tax=Leifsonia poae TaxID=110933 RepID=UPI001CC17938|nr:NAD-dependent epimerase/dehydratase family protein [Leifsonia poae]